MKFVYASDWLPLHFWLMGSLALLIRNAELASRLLSLSSGVASLWLVWRIARTIYTETAANFSLLVFSFYSLHVGYSTTSSSEAPYLFFVLAGLLCFLNYERSRNGRWLALSGVWFTLGAAIRPEAWVVILGIELILLGPPWRIANRTFWQSEHLRPLAIFIATAGSWPLLWMGFWWVTYKNPLFFLVQNRGRVLQELAGVPTSALYRAAFFPGVLLLTISPLALAGALIAVWLAVRRSPGRQIVVLVLIVGIVQFSQIAVGGLLTLARYTITLGTLLTILSGYGLERISDIYFPNITRTLSPLIAVMLAINLGSLLFLSEIRWRFSEKFASISPRLRFARYITDLGNALRPRLGPGDALVIDNYNDEPNEVAAVAGLPLLHDDRVFDAATKHQDLRTELSNFIDTKHPRYLVYSDKGLLRSVLDFPSGCPLKPMVNDDLEFRCVFANEIYSLYEVHYLRVEPLAHVTGTRPGDHPRGTRSLHVGVRGNSWWRNQRCGSRPSNRSGKACIFTAGVAPRLKLWQDDRGGPYLSDAFQSDIGFPEIISSPACLRQPEGNGCVERFMRTLKKQLLWLRSLRNLEELCQALLALKEQYDEQWLSERNGFRSPRQTRQGFVAIGAAA